MISTLAPAKVNLGLRILGRRADGFHDLQTVFQAVDLCDTLSFDPGGDRLALEVHGADVGPLEDNLVMRAARLFGEETGRPVVGRFRLEKRIPAGAGLGGGSSDAGAALRLLDHLAGGALGVEGRVRIGGRIGADVAFFAGGMACALGEGRGERLRRLDPPASRTVLVAWLPGTHVATGPAYGALARDRAESGAGVPTALFDSAPATDWPTLESILVNDFERTVYRDHPRIAALAAAVRDATGWPTLLSGSGGAVFALPPPHVAPARIVEERTALADRASDAEIRTVMTRREAPPIEG